MNSSQKWNQKTAVQEFAWLDFYTSESRAILTKLTHIGPNYGTISDYYLEAPAGPANKALKEAPRVINEMYSGYGSPFRHNNPNPFYTRDGQQCIAMNSLLAGKARLLTITPDDYIELAADWDMTQPETEPRLAKLAERFKEGLEVDAVYFTNRETGERGVYKIANQEGRHRAHAARMAGIDLLKIYLHSNPQFQEYGPVTLEAQYSNHRVPLKWSGIP